MKTYREVKKKVVDQIICDCCGQSCSKEVPTLLPSFAHEYATLEATWGYFSDQDGTQYNIELCENCFNDVILYLKKKRKQHLGPFNYPHKIDSLNGESYF